MKPRSSVAWAAALAIAASLLPTLLAPPSAQATQTPLLSSSCATALHALGSQQARSLASEAVLSRALSACPPASDALPRATFATLTVDGRTVGAVFEQSSATSLRSSNWPAATYLLLNGHPVSGYLDEDRFVLSGTPAVLHLGSSTVPGTADAVFGDGGQSISFIPGRPLGTLSAASSRAAARPLRPGSRAVAFEETGPRPVVAGPLYRGEFASVNSRVAGILTRPDGSLAGVVGPFGTGMDSREWKFWKSRSLLVPYRR